MAVAKECKKCHQTHIYWLTTDDGDPLCGYCGNVDYGDIPAYVKTYDMTSGYSWGKFEDRGCVYATKKLGKQSRCVECPYEGDCIFYKGKRARRGIEVQAHLF
jgi:hypothetical protein